MESHQLPRLSPDDTKSVKIAQDFRFDRGVRSFRSNGKGLWEALFTNASRNDRRNVGSFAASKDKLCRGHVCSCAQLEHIVDAVVSATLRRRTRTFPQTVQFGLSASVRAVISSLRGVEAVGPR